MGWLGEEEMKRLVQKTLQRLNLTGFRFTEHLVLFSRFFPFDWKKFNLKNIANAITHQKGSNTNFTVSTFALAPENGEFKKKIWLLTYQSKKKTKEENKPQRLNLAVFKFFWTPCILTIFPHLLEKFWLNVRNDIDEKCTLNFLISPLPGLKNCEFEKISDYWFIDRKKKWNINHKNHNFLLSSPLYNSIKNMIRKNCSIFHNTQSLPLWLFLQNQSRNVKFYTS